MNKSRTVLQEVIENGEEKNGSIEFKSQLNKDIHLVDGKRESLEAQLKYRVRSGNGTATYVVGVKDNGDISGLKPEEFSESMDVLSILAENTDSKIDDVSTWDIGDNSDRIVGMVEVVDTKGVQESNDLIIGTAGHVDHGKSTLIGSLVTGNPDDGEGGTRSYLDVKPHEIDRGLSADLSYAVYGFTDDGEINRMKNPNRNQDRSQVVEESDKLVSFVDTVGHQPWLRTTIRGLFGQRIDYGLLAVAADDGVTQTTREHLGLLIATELPLIVTITKTDIVSDERLSSVQMEIEKLLRNVSRTPLSVERHGVDTAIGEISANVTPIINTSAVTLDGFDKLDYMFQNLPKQTTSKGEFRMYIDKVYNISGVGPVVSGSVKSGELEEGDELLVGPLADGSFRETKARSIEMHYHRINKAHSGQMISVALSNINQDEIGRGMALIHRKEEPKATREFEAEIMVLNHPTSITDGYEPVIHLETISETSVITPKDNMIAGDTGKANFRFKFNKYNIQEGQRFIFREGSSKGVGTVTKVL